MPQELENALESLARILRPEASPSKPNHDGEHAEPAEGAREGGDLSIVGEKAHVAEEIVPVVDDIIAATDGEKRKLLGASVGHIDADGQKLLEKNEGAEGSSLGLSFESEICGEGRGDEELKKCPAGDHDEFTEKPKQKVAALVDRNEYEIEH